MRTTHVIVKGLVQGVAFREYTRRQAFTLELTGWVKNRADGSVEVLLSGPETAVEKMLKWLHQGSPYARVDEVISEEVDKSEDFTKFTIEF
jgi:acylphosphatase